MNEPRYDEDYVNLGYLKRLTESATSEINKRSRNFGTQPTTPYYINDTYMDGTNIYVCINSRVIGDFNSADWELASQYVTDGNMDARLLALDTAIGAVLEDLQEQIDGTVNIWTYEGEPTLSNEPAVNWDTPLELNKHIGDVYNDILTGDSYRFVYYDDEYMWLRITDSQAAAAYTLAQEAKTLAQGKMTVFIIQPVPPYNVGDLWAQGATGGLYRCITAKATGTFDPAHWEPAVNYDETATVIRNGLITTGSLIVKQGGSYTAGITGNSSGDASIRFWAGSDFDNRAGAPFRVTQGGKLTATGVDVSGTITATSGSFTGHISANSGSIGGFTIGTVLRGISGSYGVQLSGSPNGTPLWIGNSTFTTPKFYVGWDGAMVASNANITGVVNATSGSFTGAITATSGRVGPWYINSSGIYSNATDSFMYSNGSLRVTPSTGGRINAGSAGMLINGDGGSRPVVISDYIVQAPGGTGTSIGIRAIYGNVRIASNATITLTGGTLNFGGSRINSLGSYVLNAHTFTGGGGATMYANANCMLSPASGYYAYVKSTAAANRIATSSGGASSKNIKTNLSYITKYKDIYSDLQSLNLYTFDYKYKGVKDYTHDFGFIIDEIENLKSLSTYTKHYSTTMGFVDEETLCEEREDDKEFLKRKKINIKEWDRDSYIKTLFVLIKALQMKIDELEVRLDER